MRQILALLAIAAVVGCSEPNFDQESSTDSELFNATAMRIHPIFTQMKDWTGGDKLDGVEVSLEFQDRFGDPAKAAGTVIFELFDYRQANPDPRGNRVSNPWIGSIATLDEQRSLWNRVSRTYTFRLAYPQADEYKSYTLTALFRSNDGTRFFDSVVLPGLEEPPKNATTQPTTQPTTNPVDRAVGH